MKRKKMVKKQVQIANAIAYAPVVMWIATAKQEREGVAHRWREGG